MAMGDANAVSFGQASHVGLLLAREIVPLDRLLTLRGRVPRSPCFVGIVIDHLICFERVLKRSLLLPPTSESSRVMSSILAAYEVGLPSHAGKTFTNQSQASFWGADVDSHFGFVRPSWSRVIFLACLTASMLRLPCITVSLLQVLAGSWVAVLSFRRRSMSLLHNVDSLQRGRERTDLVGYHRAASGRALPTCSPCPSRPVLRFLAGHRCFRQPRCRSWGKRLQAFGKGAAATRPDSRPLEQPPVASGHDAP